MSGAPTETQIARLYEQHASLVFARCRRILRDEDEAWDATQEVFARAIRSWSSFEGNSTRGTWLYRIATNHCLNVIRNNSGRRQKLDQRKGERPGAGSGPDAQGRVEVLDIVRAVMEDMDEDLARLAVLYYFEDMTMREIGAALDLSESRVCQLHSRIVTRLRNQLAKYQRDLVRE